jgi:UDP-glucose 4-epimerase
LRILVVGGAGYIGSTSVEGFLDAGHDVIVYDDLSTGHASAVTPPARLVRGSVQDRTRLEALLRDERIDAVLHCAAKSLVGESMIDPALYYRHNVTGGVAMLEAMRTAGVTRLVYSSTAAVYGEPRRVPIAEADRTEPINPYGATKLAFEGAMRWFAASHDFRAISLRYFNVAGATDRNGEDHMPETHLIPVVLRVAAGEASHVQIFGQDYPTPDGTCIRDFVHVRDLGAAHLLALEATGEGDPSLEVYNLGSAAGFSVREVVEAARKVTGRSIPARVLKRRSGDPPVLVASSRRARRELGWQPRHSQLDEMLADAWAWREANPDGYARHRSGDGMARAGSSSRAGRGQAGSDANGTEDRTGAGLNSGTRTSPASAG